MKISVVCTNYNKGEMLRAALEGILCQEFEGEMEVVVVDDASTDDSPEIIREFAARYPSLVRPFFNSKNKGITCTWIDACRETTGDYIARCDGDDYWIDNLKLQKQLDALGGNPGSGWCSTDFDIIDSDGVKIGASALASGIYPRMRTFEDELAFNGMTMSSTWLVERGLMLEVNDAVPQDAVDDTFIIQLELFLRTNLTFLEDSTTVYRLGEESDSHSANMAKMEARIEKLKQTQLAYLERNESLDLRHLARLLIERNSEWEITWMREKEQRKEDAAKLLAENKRVFDELTGTSDKLMELLLKAEADRDHWREKYEAVTGSRRWRLMSKLLEPFVRGKENA